MAGSARGIRAGGAFVELFADNSLLQKGLRAAEAQLKGFGMAVAGIGAGLGALGGAITAPLLGAAKAWAESSATLVNASARTGVSVEALSALGFAAGQTGSDLEGVEIAIKKMQKALVAGSEENIQAEATFQALGLSVESLMALSPEQQFNALARAIAAIPNPTARAGAALQVFGRAGTSVLPLISNLDTLTSTAEEFGLVIGTESAEAGHRLEQSMNLLEKVTGALTKTIGSALGPVLNDFNVAASRTLKTIKDWVSENKPLVEQAFKIGVALAAVGAAFALAGGAIYTAGVVIGGISATLGSIGAAIGFVLSPIGLVIGALAGLGFAFFRYTDMGSKSLASLGQQFNALTADARTAFAGIADALRAGDIGLAAQILWTGLRVEWLQGVGFLKSTWAEWSTSAVDAFHDISASLAALMVDLWAGVKIAFIKGVDAVKEVWFGWGEELRVGLMQIVDAIRTLFEDAFRGISGTIIDNLAFVQQRFIELKALLSGKFFDPKALGQELVDAERQMEAWKAKLQAGGFHEERQQAIAAEVEKNQQAQAGRVASRDEQIAAVGADVNAQHQALADQNQAAKDARRGAAQEELDAAATDLELQKFKLDELRKQAGEKAAGLKPPGEAGPAGPEPLTPEAIDQGIQQAKSKVEVAGSFSAAALGAIGTTASKGDDQLKEQKVTNSHLEKLNKKAEAGRLVFAG